MNLRFSAIQITGSSWNKKSQSAMLDIKLTTVKDRKLLPAHIRAGGDFVTLAVNGKKDITVQTFWPGAGNTYKLESAKALPLLSKICSGDTDITIAGQPEAYHDIRKVMKHLGKVKSAIEKTLASHSPES